MPLIPFRLSLVALTVLLALALAAFLPPRPVAAHPHVWILANAVLALRDGQIERLRLTWTFDDMYSALVVEDFDGNGDGALDAAELATLAEESRGSLKDFSFFTRFLVEDRRLEVPAVAGLRAEMAGELLRYHLDIPLPTPVDPRRQTFAFSIYDDSYYVDLQLNGAGAVTLEGEGAGACRPLPGEDEGNPVYYGMVYPLIVQIRCDVS